MTPREKLQITLGVAGLSCFGLGLAFLNFGSEKEDGQTHTHRIGFWKDAGMTNDSEKEIAPWMLGGGAAAIAIAFIIRDR